MNKKSISSQLIGYSTIKLLPALVSIGLVALLIKCLPQGDYVDFSIVMSSSLIGMQFGVGWLGNSIVYYYITAFNKKSLVAGAGLASLVLTIIVGTCVGWVVFLATMDVLIAVAGAILCMTQSFQATTMAMCQAIRDVRTQLIMIGVNALSILLLTYTAFLGDLITPSMTIILIAVANVVSVGVFLLKYKETFDALKSVEKAKAMAWAKKCIEYGSPFALWVGGVLLITYSDKYFVRELANSGLYLSAKDMVIGGASFLSMPLIMVLHPIMVTAFKDGSDYWLVVKKAVVILTVAFAGFASLYDSSGYKVLGLLKSNDYAPVNIPIVLTIFSLYINSTLIYFQKELELKGKTKTLGLLMLGYGIAALVVCSVIVPKWGIVIGNIVVIGLQMFSIFTVLCLCKKANLMLWTAVIFIVAYFGMSLLFNSLSFVFEDNLLNSTIFSVITYLLIVVLCAFNGVRKIELEMGLRKLSTT